LSYQNCSLWILYSKDEIGASDTHAFQILTAGKCFNRCDITYVVGLERRGLSPNARRYLKSGTVQMTEWTNATPGRHYKRQPAVLNQQDGFPFSPHRANILPGMDYD
jgi:glutaconate CoA-transferase subunit A